MSYMSFRPVVTSLSSAHLLRIYALIHLNAIKFNRIENVKNELCWEKSALSDSVVIESIKMKITTDLSR